MPSIPNRQTLTTPQQTLQQFISNDLLNGRLQVDEEDDLLMEEIVDSLGLMRIVAFIELMFQITVPLEDITIQNFRTIRTMGRYVDQRRHHGTET